MQDVSNTKSIDNVKRYSAYTRSGIDISYGLVLGIKPTSTYSKGCSAETAEGLIQCKVKTTESGEEITEIYVDHGLQDEAVGSVLRCLSGALNKHQNYLVSFHNAFTDPTCNFHGYHWHIMVEARVHPTRDARWGRDIQVMSKCNGTTYISCENANNREALTRHVIKPPRKCIAIRGPIYNEIVLSTSPAELQRLELSPDWQGARLREDANYHRIQGLLTLMKKYRTPELVVLKQKLKQLSPKDWHTYVQLMCMPSFENISKKAIELFKTDQQMMPIEERFGTQIIAGSASLEYMNVTESVKMLREWCNHNEIVMEDFVQELFNVLGKRIKKINCFMLEGPADSGKSFIVRSLIPYYIYWGEVRAGTGANFQWMGCVDTSIIICEEPLITRETAEQAKLVLEGAPTMVNIKCKPPALLQPTPVLITSNNPLHLWCSSNREAFNTRMYHHLVRPLKSLKKQCKGLNPDMWRILFQPIFKAEGVKARTLKDDDTVPLDTTVADEVAASVAAIEQDEWDETHDPMRELTPKPLQETIVFLDPREDGQKEITAEEYNDIITQQNTEPELEILTSSPIKKKPKNDDVEHSDEDIIVPDTPVKLQGKSGYKRWREKYQKKVDDRIKEGFTQRKHEPFRG